MKLNIYLRFYILLGCGLLISCQNTQRNVEQLDNSPHKGFEEINYPKELDNYLEKDINKRETNVSDRNLKSFKNFHSDQKLPDLNYKSSDGPNNIRQMKILWKVDNYLPHLFNKNKNENFTPKSLLEDKKYENIKSSKHFDKNPRANRIRRQSPKIFRLTGNTETKKRISSADKFLNLNEEEREQLLERVFNEIKRKLNKPELGDGYVDDDDIKPQLLILNSKSKPKREEKNETEPFISKAVETPHSGKTYAATPSGSFNGAIETVISPQLKTNTGISSIGKQTGRSYGNTEHFTTNSKTFSKREDKQYKTDDIRLTTFMPEGSEQKSSMKEPVEVRKVEENKPEISSKDEITADQSDNIQSKDISFTQSEKVVKKMNINGQPQLYKILRNPSGINNKLGQNDSSKVTERMTNDSDEDRELLEYVKSNVKTCLQDIRKEREMKKEVKEKAETEVRNRKNEVTTDAKENHPKEIPPELTKQSSLFDILNNLNPNSPAFQLLRNILELTPPKPILLGENQKARAANAGLYNPPLMAEENYLDEASSEENGNDSYDMILQTDLRNLDDFVRTYNKPNMEAARLDRFWGTDLLDELLL